MESEENLEDWDHEDAGGGVGDPHGEEHRAGHEAQHDHLPAGPDAGDDVEAQSPVEARVLHGYGHDEAGHEHHVGAVQVVGGDLLGAGGSGQGQED